MKPEILWNLKSNQKYPSNGQIAEVLRKCASLIKNDELAERINEVADELWLD